MKKLHLGCGSRFLKGFLHIDVDSSQNLDYIGNINNLSYFKDSEVDEIYCSHALEYLDRDEAKFTLSEWFRVLKKGGRVYIAVPNIDALIEVYKSTSNLGTILGPLFGKWQVNKSEYIYHRTIWNKVDLENSLKDVGFINVCDFNPVEYLSNIDIDFDDYSLAFYPHMDKSGIQISLTITAQK